MEPSKKHFVRRVGLPVLALTLLTTLIALPPTRWLVWQQMQAEFRPHYNIVETPYDADKEQAVIRAHPADADLQIAAALLSPVPAGQTQSDWRIAQLQPLAARFPDNAKIYAHLLRYMTHGPMTLHRDEQDELTGNTKPKTKDTFPVPTAQQFVNFDEWAAQGERLEPDNTYFPVMRALGLFAQHKDADALAAIKRAGSALQYRDYIMEEATDEEKLVAAAYGPSSALAHLSRAAQILFPHYPQMRAVARLTIYFAMRAEQQGRVEEGIALRNDIMRIGERMRVQSHSVIGSLVGIAFTQIALQRPGGEPVFKALPGSSPDEYDAKRRAQERLDHYVAFLTHNGHGRDVLNVRTQHNLGLRTKAFFHASIEYSLFSEEGLSRLGLLWLSSLVVLVNLFGLLFLGYGAWFAGSFRSPRKKKIVWTLYSFSAIPVHLAWVFVCFTNSVYIPLCFFTSLFHTSEDLMGDGGHTVRPLVVLSLLRLAALLVPLGTVLVLMVASRISKVPMSVGVPRGFRGVTVPIACVLVMLYSGLVTATAVEERRIQNELNHMTQHEGRYLAERSGQQWP